MDTVYFKNEGLIDIRAIKTFGVSAKGGNESAIGFFGTGLKYAIAILLRHGIEFEIYIGTEKYEFSVNKQVIRGEEFNIVTMNGEELGFTSDVGKTWELWQAFRELYCNCLDEGGEVGDLQGSVAPQASETLIVVKGHTFMQVYQKRHEIILNTVPLAFGSSCEVHKGSSNNVFYRTIRAYNFCRPTLYTYNVVETCDLSEDRTFQYEFQITSVLLRTIARLSDKKILTEVLTAKDDHHEGGLDYSDLSTDQVSVEFLEVIEELKQNRRFELNNSAATLHAKLTAKDTPVKKADLNAVEEEQLNRALAFCETVFGYPISSSYEIMISETLGEGIMGAAKDDKIYLSKATFLSGTKMVSATLLEEYIHLRYRHSDMSRGMQNYLFDKLISLGEQVLGKPI